MPTTSSALALALRLAAAGWHILPLSPATKRPLANCETCRDRTGHRIDGCRCISAGQWCHGHRAATTDQDILKRWWLAEPAAVPGVAAGASGLVLIDLDTHGDPYPADPATRLLPGIDLRTEPTAPKAWNDPHRHRDGLDTLRLLARLRGGRAPWPADPGRQPLTIVTPSGGRHLWYRAPEQPPLRQALGDLGWRVDVKAGGSYGIAPGARTRRGSYRPIRGELQDPGPMPDWLAREVARIASHRRAAPAAVPNHPPAAVPADRGAAYLATVISRGTERLGGLADGRQRALAALAYQAGGLLAWSGLDADTVTEQLVDAGARSGLRHQLAARIVRRALANGLAQPLTPPRRSRT